MTRLSSSDLAKICQVHSRTFRDWLRGKYTISEKSLRLLTAQLELPLPKGVTTVDNYWYTFKGGKIGAARRMELHGPVGTPEGRRKGGINSQLRRKENPEKYRLFGCNIRKEYHIHKVSTDFAEATGVILGDGAISNYQVRVSVSSIVDRPYATFLTSLFNNVFGEKPSWLERLDSHTINLTLSGVGLVELLERWGLKRGDKVRHQVDFPDWIWRDVKFQKACVRGLMDTDGGCYFHTHKSNGHIYKNFGMCFANKSLPIVNSVAKVLKSLGIKYSFTKNNTQIFIYSIAEIKKYFELIGSNNPKNNYKFKFYSNQRSHRLYI